MSNYQLFSKFQFYIVRLEPISWCAAAMVRVTVSILYSAIRTLIELTMFVDEYVSILYSAIRTRLGEIPCNAQQSFNSI